MKVFREVLGVMVLVVWSAGCAHPISSAFRDHVDPKMTGERLIQSPERFVGQKVIVGGVVVETRNFDGYSEIEAVQIDLDCVGYPKGRDSSHGRIIFRHPGYVESMIFKEGREVTVGGSVRGVQAGKVGDSAYTFPVVDVDEMQLWESYDTNAYGSPYYWNGAGGPFYAPPYGFRYRPGLIYW